MQDNHTSSYNYDFEQVIQRTSFEDYLKQKERELKKRFTARKSSSKVGLWVMLMIIISGILGFGLYELSEKDRQLASLQNQAVAGVSDQQSNNVIASEGFSLVLKNSSPNGFNMIKSRDVVPAADNKVGSITKYTVTKIVNGQPLISGIEVSLVPYDNKLAKDAFATKYAQILGNGAKVAGDVQIPKNISLTKIDTVQKDVNYFTTVTEDNYYIVKLYTQLSGVASEKDTNSFVDTFLESLYLN